MKARLLCSSFLIGSALMLSACDSGSSGAAQNGTKVLEGKATMVLPEGFVKMPQDMLEKKYTQAAQRPQEAWYPESEKGKVSIAFSVTSNPMSDSQVSAFAAMMKQQMSALSPVVSEVTVNGRKMSRLEVTTPSAEGQVFNMMQLSSLNGKLLISTFNATEDLKEKYLQAGQEALSTLSY